MKSFKTAYAAAFAALLVGVVCQCAAAMTAGTEAKKFVFDQKPAPVVSSKPQSPVEYRPMRAYTGVFQATAAAHEISAK